MDNSRKEKIDWVRGSCIGRGCFGTVDMAVNKSDGQIFAVKSVDLTSCLAAQSEALENEIKILRSISSPWVVKYLSNDITTRFRNLHLEYMPGGTAADVAKDDGILRSRVYCLVSGLNDVHSSGIVHCDIKGRNVLIGSSPSVAKLADFGSASFATQIVSSTAGQIVPRGSPLWMAPEVVRGEYQGPESDVWSLGCTVIEMITGKPPWEEDSGPSTLLRIGYSEELPELPAQLSGLGKDFLSKCLRRDRRERWSCDQLLHHPFVSSCEPLDPIMHASPRCVLDWTDSEFSENEEEEYIFGSNSIRGRIGDLASNAGAIWDSDGWVEVRNVTSDNKDVGASLEYLDLSGAEVEILLDTEWVNLEVSGSNDGAEVATVEHGGGFSFVHGYKGFPACEIILFVNLLFLTAIICTSVWFTIMKILQLFRIRLRFQSSHVPTLPKFLTLCAVFEILDL